MLINEVRYPFYFTVWRINDTGYQIGAQSAHDFPATALPPLNIRTYELCVKCIVAFRRLKN